MSKFRSAFDGKRKSVLLDVSGDSRTKQSFKDECDINTIMKRYERSGALPIMQQREPRFIDCIGLDYQTAMLQVSEARSRFEELPARIRARFKNDPAQLLDFLGDPRNREEAVELGLVKPATPAPEAVLVKMEPEAKPEGADAPTGSQEPRKGRSKASPDKGE